MTRRGFTLAELLVALTLTSVVALLAGSVLAGAARGLRDRSERMSAEHALRVAAAGVRAALETAGSDSTSGADLLVAGATGFSVRAVRAAGVVCATAPGLLTVRAGPSWWAASRDPVAGRDSALAADPLSGTWRGFALTAAPRSGGCPDGAPGIELPVSGDSLAFARVGMGSPLRIFEPVELKLYSSAPDFWLGLRLLATAQAIQPFAGPLSGGGLGLSYEDRSGAATWDPSLTSAVSYRVLTLTERPGGLGLIRGAAPRPDSTSGYVALLNAP